MAFWYLTRATGAVALVLLTLSVVLGVVNVKRYATPQTPRFIVDGCHRMASLLVCVLLAIHIGTSVLDGYAPIRLADVVIPFGGTYRPLWLGLGALAFDLLLALVVTSLLRARLGVRAWRAIHWLAYACWPVAMLHGLGTGSDVRAGWLVGMSAMCAAAVLVAIVARLADRDVHAQARIAVAGGVVLTAAFLSAVAARRAARSRLGRQGGDTRPADRGAPMSTDRLLAGIDPHGPLKLDRHLAVHGALPHLGRELIAEVEAAGLVGRGGAGFPAAVKLAAVAQRSRPVVVVNGTEGEPMSAKDRVLLHHAPHLVLDGAHAAAAAVGAREVLVSAPERKLPGLAAALAERRGGPRFTLTPRAAGYVAGEETAVLAHLEGRPALPRVSPPRPAERGYRGGPTLVQNVETLCHLALIARHGAAWFREQGTAERPGTTLVTVSGGGRRPRGLRGRVPAWRWTR